MKTLFLAITVLASSVFAQESRWSQIYGYDNSAPVYVETNPEAKYWADKQRDARIGNLEGRMDGVEGRVSAVEGRVSNLESDVASLQRRVGRLENYSYYYWSYPYFCSAAVVTSDAYVMPGLWWTPSFSIATAYSGSRVRIIPSYLYKWSNYNTYAAKVEILSNYGYSTGVVGYIEVEKLSGYRCY